MTLAELVYPVISMSADATDAETSVREVSLYLDVSYDCVDVNGVLLRRVDFNRFIDSQGGGSASAEYSIWSDCSDGHAENFSGRVRASSMDSQGAVGWSSWVTVFESPF